MSNFDLTPFEKEECLKEEYFEIFEKKYRESRLKIRKKFANPRKMYNGLYASWIFFIKCNGDRKKADEFVNNLEMWDNPYEYHTHPFEYFPPPPPPRKLNYCELFRH